VTSVTSWTALGCDRLSGQAVTWLGASIERICYHAGVGAGERDIISVYYDSAGRAALLDVAPY
jgi:hypothetical protein